MDSLVGIPINYRRERFNPTSQSNILSKSCRNGRFDCGATRFCYVRMMCESEQEI